MFVLKTRQPFPHVILVWRIRKVGPSPASVLLLHYIVDRLASPALTPSLEVFAKETVDITIHAPFNLVEHH